MRVRAACTGGAEAEVAGPGNPGNFPGSQYGPTVV